MALFEQVNGQETTRRPQFFRDQDGRLYFSQVELKTGDPCQMPVPHGWDAPMGPSDLRGFLNPPADPEILTLVPARDRALRGYDIYIDYDRWLEKHERRQRQHMRRRVDVAKANDLNWKQEASQEDRSDLDSVVGPPPFPPRAFILAARAGNPWALGLTAEVPAKVLPLLPRVREALEARGQRHQRTEERTDPFADEQPAIGATVPRPVHADPFADGSPIDVENLDREVEDREAAEDRELTALEADFHAQHAATTPVVGGVRRVKKTKAPEPAVAGEV